MLRLRNAILFGALLLATEVAKDLFSERIAKEYEKQIGGVPIHFLASGALALICIPLMLEIGVGLPGRFLWHRFWYLYELRNAAASRNRRREFAPLDVLSGRRARRPATEVGVGGQRKDLVSHFAEHLTKQPEGQGTHVLLLGEPGSGKSTAFQRLTLELADRARLSASRPLPVLFRASDWTRCNQDGLRGVVRHAVESQAFGQSRRVLGHPDAVNRIILFSRLTLLVDGIDELEPEARHSLLLLLAGTATDAAHQHISVLVSCRTRQDPQQFLPNFEAYSILDLSDASVRAFVRIYSDKEGLDPLPILDRLNQGAFLEPGGLGRNPFWLHELIQTSASVKSRSGILAETNRQAIAKEVAKRLKTLPDQESAQSACMGALAALAAGMDLRREVRQEEGQAKLRAWLGEAGRETEGLTAETVRQIAQDANIVRVSLDDRLSFSHRLQQEYFTALGLLRDETLTRHWYKDYLKDSNRWVTMAMHAGMLPMPERMELLDLQLEQSQSPRDLAAVIAIYIGNNECPVGPVAEKLLRRLEKELIAEGEIPLELEQSLKEFITAGGNIAAWFVGRLYSSPSEVVRTRVAKVLAVAPSVEAIRLLVQCGLDDEHAEAAEAATAALAAFGEPAFWPLVGALSAPRERVRNRSIDALGRLRSPVAINYLLNTEGDPVRIGQALGACGEKAVGRLLIAFAFGSEREQILAAHGLGQVKDERAERALLRGLSSGVSKLKDACLRALLFSPHRDEGVTGRLLDELVRLVRSDSWEWADSVMRAMAGQENDGTPEELQGLRNTIAGLSNQLTDRVLAEPHEKDYRICAVLKSGEKAAAVARFRAAIEAAGVPISTLLLDLLSRLDWDAAVQVAEAEWASKRDGVDLAACLRLLIKSERKPYTSDDFLDRLLEDEPFGREAAIELLPSAYVKRNRSRLIERLLQDRNPAWLFYHGSQLGAAIQEAQWVTLLESPGVPGQAITCLAPEALTERIGQILESLLTRAYEVNHSAWEQALRLLLQSPSAEQRKRAAGIAAREEREDLAGEIGLVFPESLPLLQRCVGRGSRLWSACMAGLARLGSPEASDVLLRYLTRRPGEGAAQEVKTHCRDVSVFVRAAERHLDGEDAQLTKGLLTAISGSLDPEAQAVLLRGLHSRSNQVVRAAAEGLQNWKGDRRSIDAIWEATARVLVERDWPKDLYRPRPTFPSLIGLLANTLHKTGAAREPERAASSQEGVQVCAVLMESFADKPSEENLRILLRSTFPAVRDAAVAIATGRGLALTEARQVALRADA